MPSIFTKDWPMVKMTPLLTHRCSGYQVPRDLPLLNFSQNGSTNHNIRTRTKPSKKCSGHIHLHAFLGKLQIFQIFTYNIFSDNFESKWTSEIFILMKTYTSEARKMGGWQQQIHRREEAAHFLYHKAKSPCGHCSDSLSSYTIQTSFPNCGFKETPIRSSQILLIKTHFT